MTQSARGGHSASGTAHFGRLAMRRLTSVTCFTLGICCIAAQLLRADAKVEEQPIGPAAQGATYVVSPRGVHLATVAPKGSRMMVVVDGVAGPKFDSIVTPVLSLVDLRPAQVGGYVPTVPAPVTFSPDGSRYAYLGRLGDEWVLMADNKELARIPGGGAVGATGGIAGVAGNTDVRIQFAGDDGKHLLLAKSTINGYELWVDGQKWPGTYGSGGGGSDGTADPMINADRSRIAYMAQISREKRGLILNGKELGLVLDNMQWTPDGAHLIGIAHAPDGAHLIVDGKSTLKATQIFGVYPAPVGNRIIIVLLHQDPKLGNGQFLLVDGKPVEVSFCEEIKRVIFSPNGKHYAALCGKTGKEFMVIDGKKGQEYQMINNAGAIPHTRWDFSPDSGKLVYQANANGKWFIVTDDDESDAFNNTPSFMFSPDGKHLVTGGMQGQNWVLTVDGKPLRRQSNTAINFPTITFSPDGARYAAMYGNGNPRDGAPVLVDGVETGLSGTFLFSPDSKHIAIFGYRPIDNVRGVYIDGKLVATAETVTIYGAFTPDSQHLYWMTREPNPRKDAPPGSYEFVTYLDGKPVARAEHRPEFEKVILPTGFGQFTTTPPAWTVSADGSLTTIAMSDDGTKRIKITPTPETSITTMLADAQAAQQKGKKKR